MLWSTLVLIDFSSSGFSYSLLINSQPCACLLCRAFVIIADVIPEMWHLHCFICVGAIELCVPYLCTSRNAAFLCCVANLQHEGNAVFAGCCMEMWGLLKQKQPVWMDPSARPQERWAALLCFPLGPWLQFVCTAFFRYIWYSYTYMSQIYEYQVYTLSWSLV